MRWLNRHVEATAPWQLAKDEARADELDAVLYDLADGVRAVAVALSPYLPRDRAADPRARSASPSSSSSSGSPYGRRRRRPTGSSRGRTALPARRPADRRGVIDTHAHLDACAEPADVLVARARAAGVEPDRLGRLRARLLPRDARDRRSRARRRLRRARDPSAPGRGRPTRRGSTSCGSCSPTSAPSPSARPASTSTATTRRTTASASSSQRAARARRRARQDRRRPHARGLERDGRRCSEPFAGTVVLHCFSAPELLPVALERGYYLSFAGNVTYPKAEDLREAARAGSRRAAARRDRQPVPLAAAQAWPAERARERRPHRSPRSPRRAARTRPSSPPGSTPTRPPRSASREPAAPRRRSSASTSWSTRTCSA